MERGLLYFVDLAYFPTMGHLFLLAASLAAAAPLSPVGDCAIGL